ncbi:hypothetical protein BGZ54_003855, partial [Gamsiella multidivaricata]
SSKQSRRVSRRPSLQTSSDPDDQEFVRTRTRATWTPTRAESKAPSLTGILTSKQPSKSPAETATHDTPQTTTRRSSMISQTSSEGKLIVRRSGRRKSVIDNGASQKEEVLSRKRTGKRTGKQRKGSSIVISDGDEDIGTDTIHDATETNGKNLVTVTEIRTVESSKQDAITDETEEDMVMDSGRVPVQETPECSQNVNEQADGNEKDEEVKKDTDDDEDGCVSLGSDFRRMVVEQQKWTGRTVTRGRGLSRGRAISRGRRTFNDDKGDGVSHKGTGAQPAEELKPPVLAGDPIAGEQIREKFHAQQRMTPSWARRSQVAVIIRERQFTTNARDDVAGDSMAAASMERRTQAVITNGDSSGEGESKTAAQSESRRINSRARSRSRAPSRGRRRSLSRPASRGRRSLNETEDAPVSVGGPSPISDLGGGEAKSVVEDKDGRIGAVLGNTSWRDEFRSIKIMKRTKSMSHLPPTAEQQDHLDLAVGEGAREVQSPIIDPLSDPVEVRTTQNHHVSETQALHSIPSPGEYSPVYDQAHTGLLITTTPIPTTTMIRIGAMVANGVFTSTVETAGTREMITVATQAKTIPENVP